MGHFGYVSCQVCPAGDEDDGYTKGYEMKKWADGHGEDSQWYLKDLRVFQAVRTEKADHEVFDEDGYREE